MTLQHLFHTVSRLRVPVAFLCAVSALFLLWSGLALPPPPAFLSQAQAGATPDSGRRAALALLPKEQIALLQATVDSVALGFGGAFAEEENEELKRRALSGALNALTYSLGGNVYFTAWHGTRIVHSPGNADATDMDFAASSDSRGAPFVRGMEELADKGGFLRVLLPAQQQQATAAAGTIRLPIEDTADFEQNPGEAVFCPLDHAGSCSGLAVDSNPGLAPQQDFDAKTDARPQAAEVDQVVYVRRIPQSDWHIAAFLPVPEHKDQGLSLAQNSPAQDSPVFSSVWSDDEDVLFAAREERFRKGLRLSGLSLAGLAGLMLLPSGGVLAGRLRDDGTEEKGHVS